MPKKKPKDYTDAQLIAFMCKSGLSSARSDYYEDHLAAASAKLGGIDVVVRHPVPILKHLFGGPITEFLKEYCEELPPGTHLLFDPHLPAKFSAMLLVADANPQFKVYSPTVAFETGGRLFNLVPVTALEDNTVVYE